jgi:hypothetical protein
MNVMYLIIFARVYAKKGKKNPRIRIHGSFLF